MRSLRLFPVLLLVACGEPPPPEHPLYADPASATASTTLITDAPQRTYDQIDRATFNKMATRINAPVFWYVDANKNGRPEPDEIKTLLFYPTAEVWVKEGKFTPAFDVYYDKLVAASKAAAPTDPRLALVQKELDAAASTVVYTDLRKIPPEDRQVVKHVIVASNLIDELHQRQLGIRDLDTKIGDDPACQSLFRRDWGPICQAPPYDKTAGCTAIAGIDHPPPLGIYPPEIQKDRSFCKDIEKLSDAKEDSFHFSVVMKGEKGLVDVPYTKVYGDTMRRISAELRAMAGDIHDSKEDALKAYALAAAQSFETNDWLGADQAWAKMDSHNSKFYLRIAPDEVQWDTCGEKAGFQVSFGFINPNGVALQDKLAPAEQGMEDSLGKLIGAPYKARKVQFHLPDFTDIILNAGEARNPIGATIGESLPNWGKVADTGNGRTVAMSNLYDDPDNRAVRRGKAESLLSAEMMAFYPDNPVSSQLATVLHEATHNLGPAQDYKFLGNTNEKVFGGEVAGMLEELKAQTGALYFMGELRKKGIFTDAEVKQAYVDSMVWALNHISRGMYGAGGGGKPYSQLSAIQVGFLLSEKALIWDPKALAANGKDTGAFKIDFDRFPKAVEKLMQIVGLMKAKNDTKQSADLIKRFVDDKDVSLPKSVIAERCLRYAQPNFVYAVEE